MTINEYMATFPKEVQKLLKNVQEIVKKEAPDAEETISYGIPTFKLNGKNLVHFAAFKKHIGFYPTPSAITKFKKELSGYKQAKGSVQFPLDKPMPLALIKKVVAYRVKNLK